MAGWLLLFVAFVQPAAGDPPDFTNLAQSGIVLGPDTTYEPGRPVVVLVHGDEGVPGNFVNLKNEFARRRYNVFYFKYQEQMVTSEDGAHQGGLNRFIKRQETVQNVSYAFDDAIRNLQFGTKADTINVVAHSMGGLVARDAMTVGRVNGTLANRNFHVNLVTVATPFQGISALQAFGSAIGAVFAGMGNSYFSPMADPKGAFLSGLIGPNITHLVLETDEDVPVGGVITAEGQKHPDVTADAKIADVKIRSSHVGAITYTPNVRRIADEVDTLTGRKPARNGGAKKASKKAPSGKHAKKRSGPPVELHTPQPQVGKMPTGPIGKIPTMPGGATPGKSHPRYPH